MKPPRSVKTASTVERIILAPRSCTGLPDVNGHAGSGVVRGATGNLVMERMKIWTELLPK
jgi:hypothetical protein